METQDFEELKKYWYGKLKETGFEDAEDTSNVNCPLKTWHSFKWRNTGHDKIDSTRNYYLKAIDLLITYNFDNYTHKTIWELHCDGFSKREIEIKISTLTPTYKREQIGNIIKIIASTIL